MCDYGGTDQYTPDMSTVFGLRGGGEGSGPNSTKSDLYARVQAGLQPSTTGCAAGPNPTSSNLYAPESAFRLNQQGFPVNLGYNGPCAAENVDGLNPTKSNLYAPLRTSSVEQRVFAHENALRGCAKSDGAGFAREGFWGGDSAGAASAASPNPTSSNLCAPSITVEITPERLIWIMVFLLLLFIAYNIRECAMSFSKIAKKIGGEAAAGQSRG